MKTTYLGFSYRMQHVLGCRIEGTMLLLLLAIAPAVPVLSGPLDLWHSTRNINCLKLIGVFICEAITNLSE